MKEIAIVKETKGKEATVYLEKKDECSKCGMCIFPKNAKGVEITARNEVGAIKGDSVLIDVKDEGKLLGIFLVFIIPLLLIGVSFLLNALFIKNELWTLAIAVGLIVVWYVILSFIDKKLKRSKSYGTEIVSVLELDNKNEK